MGNVQVKVSPSEMTGEIKVLVSSATGNAAFHLTPEQADVLANDLLDMVWEFRQLRDDLRKLKLSTVRGDHDA